MPPPPACGWPTYGHSWTRRSRRTGGGNAASVAGAAEPGAALERILASLGAGPDDPDAEIGPEALADALTAFELPPSPGAPRDRAPRGKWWDWQEGKVSW